MVAKETVPDVTNFSCWSSVFQHPVTPSAADVVKAVCSSLLGLLVIVVNSIFIFAVNGKRHARHLSFQPRYLLTSLGVCDLAKGLVVVPLSVYPSLYHCWPYPPLLCAGQALLLPLLHHQAAVTLSLLALDRYWCLLHPAKYSSHASRPWVSEALNAATRKRGLVVSAPRLLVLGDSRLHATRESMPR